MGPIEDEHSINTILTVMLRSLLVEEMGEERANADYDNFSFVMPMVNNETGDKETFMVSFDNQNRYMLEKIENDSLPENSIVFFNDDKESIIVNAALYGDEFLILDEALPDSEPDPDDHFLGPKVP